MTALCQWILLSKQPVRFTGGQAQPASCKHHSSTRRALSPLPAAAGKQHCAARARCLLTAVCCSHLGRPCSIAMTETLRRG